MLHSCEGGWKRFGLALSLNRSCCVQSHIFSHHISFEAWEKLSTVIKHYQTACLLRCQAKALQCISIGDGLIDKQGLSNKPLNLISVSLNYKCVESMRGQKNCNPDIFHGVIGSRLWSWEIRNACEKVGKKRKWRLCLKFIYKSILISLF